MLKPTTYTSEFKKTMLSGRENDSIRFNNGSGIQYQYTLLVDTNRHNDFKRGIFWKNKSKTNLQLGIHSPNDIADIKGTGIDIYPGYETTIRINFQELYSDPSIRSIEPIKRQCKFDDENEDIGVFKWYSRVNCLFECSMSLIEKECGCRPWDYPKKIETSTNSLNQESRICDYFGNTCFHALMKTEFGEKQCLKKCHPDCNEVKYTFSVEKTPFNPENICEYSADEERLQRAQFKDVKNLETSVRNHVSGYPQSKPRWGKMAPINDLIRMVQDNLKHQNKSTPDINMCMEKLMKDVAVVHIVVNNPTVMKLIQTNRVSSTDKLANFGMFLTCFAVDM